MTVVTSEDSQKAVRGWLENIAGSRHPSESVKGMLRRLSDSVGLSPSRIKKLWYGEADKIAWHEAEMIRQRAERRDIIERWGDYERRREIAELRARLERLERNETAQVVGCAMVGEPTLGLGRTSTDVD